MSGRRLVPAAWGGILLLVLAGCPSGGGKVPAGGGTAAATGAAAQSEADAQCANLVSSIHDTFQLQRLGQTTRVSDGVLRLNDWWQSCGPKQDFSPMIPERLRALVSDEQADDLKSARFTLRDGEHVRDRVLIRSLARLAFEVDDDQGAELPRVVAAFEFVIRSVELIEKHPQDLPLTPYEFVLLGKGTAADRAWLFASLLRQLKIDTVLIVPASSAEGQSDARKRFLVGAILDGQPYLFDPRSGVPIPPPGAADAPPPVNGVATLEQAAGDPSVLKQLDVDDDHPYAIKAADLDRPDAYLITDPGFWSERMRVLQGQFSGEFSMVVSDPLQDSDEGPGLWSRVGKAGGTRWTADSLRVWDYPESQLGPHATMSDAQKDAVLAMFSAFDAYSTLTPSEREGKVVMVEQEEVNDPAAGKFDPGRAKRVRTTKGTQRRARLLQVGGDLSLAVQIYHEVWQRSNNFLRTAVQLAAQGIASVEQDKIVLHARAIDDASFWSAQCKFQQKNYRVAVSALERYRTQHPQGAWLRQCRYLLALSLAAQEDYQGAVDELEAVDANDPEYAGYQWLVHQWRSAEPTEADGNGAEGSGAAEKAVEETPKTDDKGKTVP